MGAKNLNTFVGCFSYVDIESDEEGSFEIVVEAKDVRAARARCRKRLNDFAKNTNELGPVNVYADAFVELARGVLEEGALVNLRSLRDNETRPGREIEFRRYLPTEPSSDGCKTHFPDEVEINKHVGTGSVAEPAPESPFWRGAKFYASKWKLWWCETGDHDEDWFVVARSEREAAKYHEDEEGYDHGDAWAELVCVLPIEQQAAAKRQGAHWPSPDVIIACGGEFLPHVPQDGANELREAAGSGSRVVRIRGKVYAEGDIVGNVMRSRGLVTES